MIRHHCDICSKDLSEKENVSSWVQIGDRQILKFFHIKLETNGCSGVDLCRKCFRDTMLMFAKKAKQDAQ